MSPEQEHELLKLESMKGEKENKRGQYFCYVELTVQTNFKTTEASTYSELGKLGNITLTKGSIGQSLLLLLKTQNTVLDSVWDAQAMDKHFTLLSNAMNTVYGLILDSRVPPRIHHHDTISRIKILAAVRRELRKEYASFLDLWQNGLLVGNSHIEAERSALETDEHDTVSGILIHLDNRVVSSIWRHRSVVLREEEEKRHASAHHALAKDQKVNSRVGEKMTYAQVSDALVAQGVFDQGQETSEL